MSRVLNRSNAACTIASLPHAASIRIDRSTEDKTTTVCRRDRLLNTNASVTFDTVVFTRSQDTNLDCLASAIRNSIPVMRQPGIGSIAQCRLLRTE